MSEIIPAVLGRSLEEFRAQVSSLPREVGFIHIDVLEEDVWERVEQEFEAHLMVREPLASIERWVERGAKRIILHAREQVTYPGVEMGLGVELEEVLEEVLPHLEHFDFVHLMSIREIGAQGRPFETEIFDRIKAVREKFPDMPISIDGGVGVSNYQKLLDTGATRLVVGSGFDKLWQNLQTRGQ